MTAREELARDICRSLDMIFGKREFGPATQDYTLADALLAEGWGKRRTVATVEELDALPVGSVVMETEVAVRVEFGWRVSDLADLYQSNEIALPATVLYEPQS